MNNKDYSEKHTIQNVTKYEFNIIIKSLRNQHELYYSPPESEYEINYNKKCEHALKLSERLKLVKTIKSPKCKLQEQINKLREKYDKSLQERNDLEEENKELKKQLQKERDFNKKYFQNNLNLT